MVPGGLKTFPYSLEVFLKKTVKRSHFSVVVLFPKSRGIFKNVLSAKNVLLGELKIPKIAPESKNTIFSKSEKMISQSNLGKRKVKLMLVRP